MKRVLVDSMVIIEAHRTRCWNALLGRYRIETVDECIVECGTGNQQRRGYIPVDIDQLRKRIHVAKPTATDLFELDLRLGGATDIHKGERHLLAYAVSLNEEWVICAPENAVLRAAMKIGLLDRFISLEAMASRVGLKPEFRGNFTRKWLKVRKTQLKLEVI